MTAHETQLCENRKSAIKFAFKQIGLPICEPRDSGQGSSNDGKFITFFIKLKEILQLYLPFTLHFVTNGKSLLPDQNICSIKN